MHFPDYPREPPHSPYGGMTINERLVMAGLIEPWEAAVIRRDRAEMLRLLVLTDLSIAAAEQTTDMTLANPKFYGF
ncbi:MAG TPA: hypothetical protein VHV55_15115 [Pirellulales bacterium]|jgi:hypothetical protein|nr:hypothetical protein [Pirellulales bacterium]